MTASEDMDDGVAYGIEACYETAMDHYPSDRLRERRRAAHRNGERSG